MQPALLYLQKILPPSEYQNVLDLVMPYIKPQKISRPNKKIEIIKKTVAQHLGIEKIDLWTRKPDQVKLRQLSFYFIQLYNLATLEDTGKVFHEKSFDHTTIIHSCRAVNNLIFSDPEYRELVNSVHEKIKAQFFSCFESTSTH